MLMPETDASIVARRDAIVARLKSIVPDGVVSDRAGLKAFDGDALTAYRQSPLVCVLPRTKEEVAAVLRYASEAGGPIVPRVAGTSLSGGALPRGDAILNGLSLMNRILDIDLENRAVTVEPGVTN